MGCEALHQPLLGRELSSRGGKGQTGRPSTMAQSGSGLVFVCFPRRIEILDWWHTAPIRLADCAEAMGPDSAEASAWVDIQKAALSRSQHRLFFRRNPLLSEALQRSKGLAYLWKNRRRMNYAAYRKAGFPISSGTVKTLTTHETSWHALVSVMALRRCSLSVACLATAGTKF